MNTKIIPNKDGIEVRCDITFQFKDWDELKSLLEELQKYEKKELEYDE